MKLKDLKIHASWKALLILSLIFWINKFKLMSIETNLIYTPIWLCKSITYYFITMCLFPTVLMDSVTVSNDMVLCAFLQHIDERKAALNCLLLIE